MDYNFNSSNNYTFRELVDELYRIDAYGDNCTINNDLIRNPEYDNTPLRNFGKCTYRQIYWMFEERFKYADELSENGSLIVTGKYPHTDFIKKWCIQADNYDSTPFAEWLNYRRMIYSKINTLSHNK